MGFQEQEGHLLEFQHKSFLLQVEVRFYFENLQAEAVQLPEHQPDQELELK